MAVHQSVWLCCAHRGHGGASDSVAVLCSQRPWRGFSQCACAVLTEAMAVHQSVWLCCAHRGYGGASVSVAVLKEAMAGHQSVWLCSQRP
ncbi:hypothetical protein ACOMHN_017448 [Nucella lapillus]